MFKHKLLHRRWTSRMAYGLVAASMSLVVIGSAVPAQAQVADSAGYKAMLQDYADQLHDAGVSGVLVQARDEQNDPTRVRAGVGSRLFNTPVPWQANFRTGSTTKTFVATVVLQLVAENKMSLDDTIEDWLPGLMQGTGYNGSEITVRQLLQHTSGIFDYTSDDAFWNTVDTPAHFMANRFKNWTPQQLINLAKAHPPVFAPGTSWEYSNTNYIIVGQIIKAVTGKEWDVEVKNRIITPLHLNDTKSSGSNPFMPLPHAQAYHIYTEDSNDREYTNTTIHNLSWGDSAGDLITTPRDENKFLRALLSGQLLPPAQLTAMKTVVPVDETFSYGLGLMWSPSTCDSEGIWSHDGGTVGYATSNGVTDDGSRSIVVSLATTTFTDLEFAEETFALRTGIVNDALCYGPESQQSRGQAAPAASSKRSTIRF